MTAVVIPFPGPRPPARRPWDAPPVLSARDREVLDDFGREAHELGIDGMAREWGMGADLAREVLALFPHLAPAPPRLAVVR